MRRIIGWLTTVLLTACLAPGFARADVDLRATGISFDRGEDGGIVVHGFYGVWHDEGQVPFLVHVELRQLRDGEVVRTLWSSIHGGKMKGSSDCQAGCRYQDCIGSCMVDTTRGRCRTLLARCGDARAKKVCMCEVVTPASSVREVRSGDVFELSVEPVGIGDLDPSDNVIRMTWR